MKRLKYGTKRVGATLKTIYSVTAGPHWMNITLYEGTDQQEAREVFCAAKSDSLNPNHQNFCLVVYLRTGVSGVKEKYDPRSQLGMVSA